METAPVRERSSSKSSSLSPPGSRASQNQSDKFGEATVAEESAIAGHADQTAPDDPAEQESDHELNDNQTDEFDPLTDEDSAYGSSIRNDETSSLDDDILRYRVENGRTYHRYGSTEYWGSNDEESKDQQDLSHHFWTLITRDKFFFAPIENPQNILDLGCGTGIWAIDVGDRYPSAVVKGIDISPIQPYWTPPNVVFEIDDFNKIPWDIEAEYDLIHQRELLGSIPDCVAFYKEAFRALKPGGWIDCSEPDIKVCGNSKDLDAINNPNVQWVRLFREVAEKSGMDFEIGEKLKVHLEAAGFVNVKELVIPVAVGRWPADPEQKAWGLWNMARLNKGMRDFTERRMRNFMGWNDDEIEVLIARSRSAVNNSRLQQYQNMHFCWAQKPE